MIGGSSTAIRWRASASATPLTQRQVLALIIEARKAHEVQRALGLADEPFDVWRRGAAQDALGRSGSWRAFAQRDFAPLMAYLKALALGTWQRGGTEEDDARRARYVLGRVTEASAEIFGSRAGAEAYRAALCRSLFPGRGEQELAAEELWRLCLTLRSRAAAARRRKKA